ncbi:DUF4116 domain-containing protein [Chitinophaga vietnamensis]|uniref:DUF4116 domain-containing protein n=1 Tax=Chitinophaga vietnamensis TaxID=2593957 RepID=UPI00117732F2|nr:DUF4116 domain-containing protein [Chitinophaga vietnamensis]
MKNLFELIPMVDAVARYHVHKKIYEGESDFNGLIEPDSYWYVHEGDLLLNEDFILDTDELADASPDKWVAGYIIHGNLIVNGSVLNEEGDYGPALLVTGSLVCRHLLIGGSPVNVEGDITAEEVVMLHYNHSWMACGGLIKAPVFIADDFHFVPKRKKIADFYYNSRDVTSPEENACYEDEYGDEHIAETLTALLKNPSITTFEELRRRLATGESVLKSAASEPHDVTYFRNIVQKNYRDLKTVPPEFLTKELCMLALQQTVFALQFFPSSFIDETIVRKAVEKDGMALRYVPEHLITKTLCYQAVNNGGLLGIDIPEQFYEPGLLLAAIRKKDFQMEKVPANYITEDLLVEYVKAGRGAYLDRYCESCGISKQAVLHRVIDADIAYLQNIFGWHLSEGTYQYAKLKYDKEAYAPQWAAFSEQYAAKIKRVLKT